MFQIFNTEADHAEIWAVATAEPMWKEARDLVNSLALSFGATVRWAANTTALLNFDHELRATEFLTISEALREGFGASPSKIRSVVNLDGEPIGHTAIPYYS
jgi:hypothetical protein